MSFNYINRMNAGPILLRPFRAGERLTPMRLNELVDAMNRRRPAMQIPKRIARAPFNPERETRTFKSMSEDIPPNRKIWGKVNTTSSVTPSTISSGGIWNGGPLQGVQTQPTGTRQNDYQWIRFATPIKGAEFNLTLECLMNPNLAAITMNIVGYACFRTDYWDVDNICWNNQPKIDKSKSVGINWNFTSSSNTQHSEAFAVKYVPPRDALITGMMVYVESGVTINVTSAQVQCTINSIMDETDGIKIPVSGRKSVSSTRTIYCSEPHGLYTGQYVFIDNVDSGDNTYYNNRESEYGEIPVQITVLDTMSFTYSGSVYSENFTSCAGHVYL